MGRGVGLSRLWRQRRRGPILPALSRAATMTSSRSLLRGTGLASGVLYAVLYGALFWFLLAVAAPGTPLGVVGAGFLAADRLEANALNARLAALENEAAEPLA